MGKEQGTKSEEGGDRRGKAKGARACRGEGDWEGDSPGVRKTVQGLSVTMSNS